MLQPWLSFYDNTLCQSVLAGIKNGLDMCEQLNQSMKGLKNANGKPLQCVPHAQLPKHMPYEQYIFDTGGIPTRTLAHSKGSLHDVCNALVWIHYPRTKSVLNQLQAQTIDQNGIQSKRGLLRDAITLFDESAVVINIPFDDPLPEQLHARDWLGALYLRRSDWHSRLHVHMLGHANIQKLQMPYPGITAQTWFLKGIDGKDKELVDKTLSENILQAYLNQSFTPKCFLPLPLLGIPNWCIENANPAYYMNSNVFRPKQNRML